MIAVVVIASIIAVTMITVNERSQELPDTLNLNFKNLGSYALQYAVNQIVDGEVTESGVYDYTGEDEFRVLNGQINKIEYKFSYADVTVGGEGEEGEEEENNGGGLQMSGWLNINPGNSSNNQFQITTPSGEYDRWDLHNLSLYGYDGKATEIKVRPKGSGGYININGENIHLSNTRYTITSDDMDVFIYNTRIRHGKAMGKWWIEINATDAMIDPLPNGVEIEEEEDDPVIDPITYTLLQNVEIIADVSSNIAGHVHDHTSSAYLEADTKVDFEIIEDGTVVVNDKVDVTFTALGVAFGNTNNKVKMEYSLDGGIHYEELWNDNYIQRDWEEKIEDVDPGTEIVLKATWYDYGFHYQISKNTKWTDVYRNGDQASHLDEYDDAWGNQAAAEEFLASYISTSNQITLGPNDAIFLFELGHATRDYQDAVMLMTFQKSGDSETVYIGDLDLETDNYKVIYWKP